MSKRTTVITGVSDSRSARMIARRLKNDRQCLVIVPGQARAERLMGDLSFFTARNIVLLGGEDERLFSYETRNRDQNLERARAVKLLNEDPEAIIIAPVGAALKKMPPASAGSGQELVIRPGTELEPAELRDRLILFGFERVEQVMIPGQFAMRGGVADVFVPESPDPCRVEFFGDEVDSVRTFDAESQRSIENIEELTVYPRERAAADAEAVARAIDTVKRCFERQQKVLVGSLGEGSAEVERLRDREAFLLDALEEKTDLSVFSDMTHYFYDRPGRIWDYMPGGMIVLDDPDRILEHVDLVAEEQKQDLLTMLERGQAVPEDEALIMDRQDILNLYEERETLLIQPFAKQLEGVSEAAELISSDSRQMASFSGHVDMAVREIKGFTGSGYRVAIACGGEDRRAGIREMLEREGIYPVDLPAFTEESLMEKGRVYLLPGALSSGMVFPAEKTVYISDEDIFGHRREKSRRRSRSGRKLSNFAELEQGDFVVHENHGIGRFLGIEQLTTQGEQKDYIKIKYAGGDLLYVPVSQMDIVQKYVGSEGVAPKINKLSGDDWKNTKARAKAAVASMADELVQLYGRRRAAQGYAFAPDTVWQQDFEEAFPYEETDDQLKAAREIKEDMEKPEPMDRLLCGDVGYGKTEVAARAIFKCLAEGRQAAVLVPTTILANQHYETLKARFADYPFIVEMMSRFRSEKDQEQVVKDLKTGMVDLVIGTHRLLSKDVEFRDLGLLVIDEEQRFGVAHKERIKEMKIGVDVLTLSATPIPRTLNMSLTGIKDMSLITEPPEDRYPVQTYVVPQDDMTIREVIARELDRNGQVFVVYNRVRGIARIADKIKELIPEARVAVGHGQMSERTLEEVMRKFYTGEVDVLVATTIIESGLDIPNANTLIVLDADKCGLSQLYQLRGRVGRSRRMAYAYLMYQKEKVLTEIAEKRLRAIREFTEFGAGFKIAMRDMEIRGAGNILGAEQSGHMMDIGYELYCKLVDDAVRRAKGEAVPEPVEDMTVELNVNANIPSWYIDSENLKLNAYKRIAGIGSREEMEDVIDELLDRFGDLPKESLALIKVSYIRTLAQKLGVTRIYERADHVYYSFDKGNILNPYMLMNLRDRFGGAFMFHDGREPYIRLLAAKSDRLDKSMELLELLEEGRPKN
ncbi:MAG: transcription-repair coupling factor [Clostridia bacterium]|nr:transcription-repair coupling factor [Clostridia bacterium]